MAVPGGRNGLGEDDDEEILEGEEEDQAASDAWANFDLEEVPPHLRPLVDACKDGDADALRSALDTYTGNIDDPIEDGDTLLHLACLYGHLSCVKLLLERGANLERKDEEGGIPLHDACAGGFTDITRYILDFASDREMVERMLNSVDSEGDTPLHHAARGEHAGVVMLLLESGAAPNRVNSYGQTPCDLADPETDVRNILEALKTDISADITGR